MSEPRYIHCCGPARLVRDGVEQTVSVAVIWRERGNMFSGYHWECVESSATSETGTLIPLTRDEEIEFETTFHPWPITS